jgi:hypothetical protein
MLKKIALGLSAAVAAFLLFVASRPSEYAVERKAVIEAAPAAVHARVADFSKWDAWSPWEKLDPAMKRQLEGTQGAAGASYAWQGNKDVGSGKMTLVETKPGELARIKLEFFEPMAGVSDTLFTFAPEGKGTAVTWRMTGKNSFVGKAMCVFMNMDKMVGGDFEKGLAQLKALLEKKQS